MAKKTCADVVVHLCENCIPEGTELPRQWVQNGSQVQIIDLPCSGKIDIQYHFHAIESGVKGLAVVTCPPGECKLAQGNYRAEVRILTIKGLLKEIGLDPGRVELLRCMPDESIDSLEKTVREAVERFSALAEVKVAANT